MKKLFYILIASILIIVSSCATEDSGFLFSYKHSSLTVKASIEARTKAAVTDGLQDQWSKTDFGPGDVLGLYSQHGNWNDQEGLGPFINVPLTNEGGDVTNFKNSEITISPTHITPSTIFMYYPYKEGMSDQTDEEGSITVPATGLELRESDKEIYKCIDFLTDDSVDVDNLNNGKLTGKFYHAFSELIIMRGDGFDDPPEGCENIEVVLNNPITHVKINYTIDPWYCSPVLYYDNNNSLGLSREDAYRWEAWQGENYGITDENPDGVPAWYVLLPTIGKGANRSVVDYIEIYDNDGYLQQVSSIPLAKDGNNFTKNLNERTRYPLLVTMKELVPTINPFPIESWQGDNNLTNVRERGIENITDFERWVEYYNEYLENGNEENLYSYGDRIVDTNGKTLYWHFYLLGDIDFTGSKINNGIILSDFNDIIDGTNPDFLENNQHPNFTISGLLSSFIDNLKGKGTVQNINFNRPSINSNSENPLGIIANQMSAGTVINNCLIDNGQVVGNGPVGIIAGSATSATISYCTFSGSLFGSVSDSSSNYAVGEQRSTEFNKNLSNGVTFNIIN